jgi:hypothetical protein
MSNMKVHQITNALLIIQLIVYRQWEQRAETSKL